MTRDTVLRPNLRAFRGTPAVGLGVLILLGIAVNGMAFASADRSSRPNWRAVHRYSSADFATITYTNDSTIRDRYGLHLALAELAPESRVITAESALLSGADTIAELYGIGKVAVVAHAPDEVVDRILVRATNVVGVNAPLDANPFVVARGESIDDGTSWAIALDRPDVRPPDLQDPDSFIDKLLSSGRHGATHGPPRELLLLAWRPGDTPGPLTHFLLVETSLLTQELRKGLAP